MASRRAGILRQLASLVRAPIIPLVFSGMWLAATLGFTRQVFLFLGRGMQSPRLKAGALRGYRPGPHDVFVCTYSKSGTNWAMQIAHQIAHRGRGQYEHIHDVVPWPESPLPYVVGMRDMAAARQSPSGQRVIKTHLESGYVPYSPEAKYIVVLRDPKEIFVSSYHFSAGMLPRQVMIAAEEWLDLYLSERFPYGSWAAHTASYWPWRGRDNVLLLTFAEMKADLPGAVRRVAELMQVSLSEAELAAVVEQSGFAAMQQIDHKFRPIAPFPFDRLLGQPVMIRRGEGGRSSELLSPAQQAEIDRHMRAELARHGCDLPYAELFPPAEAARSVGGPEARGR